jgi:D-alanyl-D-alanine carboxypeptidase/D-alanyl-D-alanine-endopeptidase (penicillin-binding protein 4)
VSKRTTAFFLPLIILGTFFTVPLLNSHADFFSRDQPLPAATPTSAAAKVSAGSEALSNQPADVALAQEIDQVIDKSDLTQARWGVFVMSMKDGRVLCSHNGDRLFTPASNMKVYTTAVALDLLGPDFRWRTSVYTNNEPGADGVINGDVTLFGRGAPDLESNDKNGLASLADQIYQRGVRQIHGNIIGDASYFHGEMHGEGWQWNDLLWYFGADASALTVDENSIQLQLTPNTKIGGPATLTLSRAAGYLHLINNTTTVERDSPSTIGIDRGSTDLELRVWGDFPIGSRPFGANLSVPNPALLAATLFKRALIARGIKVEGEVRSRDSKSPDKEQIDPQNAFEIAQANSAPLTEIVRHTNKESDNLYAELILRTLGKERTTSAPDTEARKNRRRGDDEAGTALVKTWLDRNGIPTNNLAIVDGSGLSRLDLVTPEATVRLLLAIAKTNSAAAFRDSLPVAGRDGTLSDRLNSASGRVFAKTGTLTYSHSLSGYATAQNGETVAFSIFCNDATGRTNPVRVIDQIAGAIAGLGRPSPSK